MSCQTSVSLVTKLLEGTDAWLPFLDAIRGERGATSGEARNPNGLGGWTGKTEGDLINCDNITVNQDDGTATIPLDPDTPRTPARAATDVSQKFLGNPPLLQRRTPARDATD